MDRLWFGAPHLAFPDAEFLQSKGRSGARGKEGGGNTGPAAATQTLPAPCVSDAAAGLRELSAARTAWHTLR